MGVVVIWGGSDVGRRTSDAFLVPTSASVAGNWHAPRVFSALARKLPHFHFWRQTSDVRHQTLMASP